MTTTRIVSVALVAVAFIVALGAGAGKANAVGAGGATATAALTGPETASTYTHPLPYTNPLRLDLGSGRLAEQCADPDVIRADDAIGPAWYLYCTRDALDSGASASDGTPSFVSIPTYRSTDLVNWTFAGEALPTRPAWIGDGDMWAPDVVRVGGRYLLYYTATTTTSPGGGSAIGVATSASPTGPWVDSGGPVVEPMPAPGAGPSDRRWLYDPEVLVDGDRLYLYFGSYHGGLSVRELRADGLVSLPETQHEIALPNRYEATHLEKRDGWYYLTASATNCCAGPATGYAVFAARSTSPNGPFLDRTGTSLLAGRVGGTPVLHQNGNRWIGTGHHTTVTDLSGQEWIVYHAVDRFDPYFGATGTYTKRPALIDPLDWRDGWPVARGGQGPSETAQPAPVTVAGAVPPAAPAWTVPPRPGTPLPELSEEFDGASPGPSWSWTREPVGGHRVSDGVFQFDTQGTDLSPDPGAAGLLTEPAPDGDYVVETRVALSVPPDGCCQNYVQGGLVIVSDDATFVKHAVTSIWETRQTEFARRLDTGIPGAPVYGNTVGGPVGEWTWLRIVRTHTATESVYTGYTSLDGQVWDESGAWTLPLGGEPSRIGLVSMAGAGFTTSFDFVRVSRLAENPIPPVPSVPPVSPVAEPIAGGNFAARSELAASGSDLPPMLLLGCAAAFAALGVALRRARVPAWTRWPASTGKMLRTR